VGARGDAFRAVRSPSAADLIAASIGLHGPQRQSTDHSLQRTTVVKRQFMVAEALRPSWLRAWPSCLARQSLFGVSDASRPGTKLLFAAKYLSSR
jgi:hypothetical protein